MRLRTLENIFLLWSKKFLTISLTFFYKKKILELFFLFVLKIRLESHSICRRNYFHKIVQNQPLLWPKPCSISLTSGINNFVDICAENKSIESTVDKLKDILDVLGLNFKEKKNQEYLFVSRLLLNRRKGYPTVRVPFSVYKRGFLS